MMELTTRQRSNVFIAIETNHEDRTQLQSFGTEVMRWADTIWIMDVSLFLEYWKRLASKSNKALMALWRHVLNQTFGTITDPSMDKVLSLTSTYRASCARNPWTAVLLLYAMKEKEVFGLVGETGRFGQSLWRDLSWEMWWQAVSDIEAHFLRLKFNRFKRPAFRRHRHRLQLAANRLGFKRPKEMQVLNYNGIKTRYGKVLADLWQMSYGENDNKNQTPSQMGFPWESGKFPAPPAVTRHTEYPLLLWEQIHPLLMDDLDQLCKRLTHTGERVTGIDWKITLEDMSDLTIPIRFRNPHNLKGELGVHTTTLLQASYGFEHDMNTQFSQILEDDLGNTIPGITVWELSISGSIVIPPLVRDLFGELSPQNSDLEVLLRLENELPIPLQKFSSRGDWLPEDSYMAQELSGRDPVLLDETLGPSLEAVAEKRPLYIRHSPTLFQPSEPLDTGEFLESTMNKWWKEEHGHLERDYYKNIDPEGNSSWVFRDSSGKWYQHGIFG